MLTQYAGLNLAEMTVFTSCAMALAVFDIGKAVELAPDDADVLLQAGTIAGTAGDAAGARSFYERAIKAAPSSDAAKAAEAALKAPPPEAPQPDEEE